MDTIESQLLEKYMSLHCGEIFDTKRALDELYYHPNPTTLSCVVWHVDGCGLRIRLFWSDCWKVVCGMKRNREKSILVRFMRVHIGVGRLEAENGRW